MVKLVYFTTGRTMAQYAFDHNWKEERDRLASIERMLDPITVHRLESIGIKDGWRCLEVGAGGGSIAEWLCDKVGPHGSVVATDLQTKFLEALLSTLLRHERCWNTFPIPLWFYVDW